MEMPPPMSAKVLDRSAPSKVSTVWRAMRETVTLTDAVLPPPVTVMVPVPGEPAVNLPSWVMVPTPPVTAQVKQPASAVRGRWL